jgi:hypothetical protein
VQQVDKSAAESLQAKDLTAAIDDQGYWQRTDPRHFARTDYVFLQDTFFKRVALAWTQLDESDSNVR